MVWRSKLNGAVLARSSQPNVGLLGWRLNEDEYLLKAVADACVSNGSGGLNSTAHATESSSDTNQIIDANLNDKAGLMLIIDARCLTVAIANRVKGGGYEFTEYYTNCEIQFMNLENIHVIRSSFQSLRILCQSITDNKT